MEENLLVGKKSKLPIVPMIFIVSVLVITIGLFVLNKVYEKTNNSLGEENQSLETAINELKSKKEIELYELLSQYSGKMSELETQSDIVKYMEHLDELEKIYGINFSGFNISNGEIRTSVVARKVGVRGETNTYEKVRDFIAKYREDKEALFELKPVNSFEGMDEIKFSVNFRIKSKSELNQANAQETQTGQIQQTENNDNSLTDNNN